MCRITYEQIVGSSPVAWLVMTLNVDTYHVTFEYLKSLSTQVA